MPLIECPDCHRQISDIAPSCPGCGRPINKTRQQQAPGDGPTIGDVGKGIWSLPIAVPFLLLLAIPAGGFILLAALGIFSGELTASESVVFGSLVMAAFGAVAFYLVQRARGGH